MRRAVASLQTLPRRLALAEEDQHVAYEVRRVVVGQHLLLFTIDEANERVIVVGFRHGRQLPVVDELPPAGDLFEE